MVKTAKAAFVEVEAEESAARERAAALRVEADLAREEARSLVDQLAAAESRARVLEELASRREGTPAAARVLLESNPGAVLVVEALRVTPGYERAVAAALGPLASAVVAPGATDAVLLRGGEGLVEIVWPEAARQLQLHTAKPARLGHEVGDPGADSHAGADGPVGVDLWDVVDGPEPVVRALKAILPATRVVAGGEAPALAGTGRVVTAEGEIWHGQVHGARRGEAAAGALLAVRAELEAVRTIEASLRVAVEGARQAAERRSGESAAADADVAAASGRAREARTDRDSLVDEVALWGRRFEEAEAEAVEAEERRARDADLARELEEGLASVEVRLEEIAGRLEVSRAGLRSVKERSQTLRAEVAVLEGKRSQAAVLAVRLRERERAREEERERTRAHAQRAERVLALAREKETTLEDYLPVLQSLAEVTAPLVRALQGELLALSERVARSRAATDDFGDALKDQGRRESDLQRVGSELNEELVRAQVALAHLEEQASERRRELEELRRKHWSPRDVDAESVAGLDPDTSAAAIERAERKRDRIGPVNPLAEQEFREMEERAHFLAEQRHDLEASLAELRTVIRDLEEHIETTFTEVFEATRQHFEEMVKILFPGGKGVLRLVEAELPRVGAEQEDEPGEDGEAVSAPGPGIVLEIKPPRKTPRNMNLLSGGEKALAAIAFLFGLFLARPCPFYVLDEVEAALDDLNLGRFLALVRRYQQRTQFIVITHQRRTMEIADRLYGVAMDNDGTSRVLSRRLGAEGTAGGRS
jgi:chromosome segregation protein